MATTSIRVSEETRQTLARIRAQLTSADGEVPTMDATVAALADHWQNSHPSARSA